MSGADWFAQDDDTCRLEWGHRGAEQAAARGDILVVVDVLSFSTTAATGIAHGAVIYPVASNEEARKVAARAVAEIAVYRRDVPAKGRFSLSPRTFEAALPGTKVVLPSPNGAACCELGKAAPRLFVGALVNAAATARAACRASKETGRAITVLACGERWQNETETSDGPLRFALEDYLGAGAIFAHLPADLTRSPEARVAQAAFQNAAPDLLRILLRCGSGIELVDKGREFDVRHANLLNLYDVAAAWQNGGRLEAEN